MRHLHTCQMELLPDLHRSSRRTFVSVNVARKSQSWTRWFWLARTKRANRHDDETQKDKQEPCSKVEAKAIDQGAEQSQWRLE